MRKLFAMVATVAVVLSMFSGIAFAAAAPAQIMLNTPSFISSGAAIGFQTISGSIVATATGALISDVDTAITVAYVDNAGAAKSISTTAVKGQISFMIPSDIPAQIVTLTATDNGSATFAAVGKVAVKYNVTLQTPLEFQYSATPAPVAVIGSVKDSAGKAVVGKAIELWFVDSSNVQTGTVVASATTNATGDFGFVVNTWAQAGKLGLFVPFTAPVEDVLLATGNVASVAMTLTVTPNTGVVHTIASTTLKFKVTGATGVVDFTIKKGTTVDVAKYTGTVVPVAGVVEETLAWSPANGAGTYTVEATIGGTHKATATVLVVDPVAYNLLNASLLEKMDVAGATINFGSAAGNVGMMKYNANGSTDTTFQYVVDVDDVNKMAKAASGSITIAATTPGTKQIRVRVYDDTVVANTFDQLVYDKVFTLVLSGWTLTSDVTTMSAGETKTITVVVKNNDGVPVNNAYVTLGTLPAIDGATTNIQNGTYVFKDAKFATPGDQALTVKTASAGTTKVTSKVTVTGQAVYTVTAPVSTLLLASGEKMVVTVAKNGVNFIPAKFMIQVGTDAATVQPVTPKDTNADGIYDAVEMTVTPALDSNSKMKDMTLTVSNATGTEYGEVKFTVVAPTLEVLNGNKNLTDNVYTDLKFRVVDPRTNTPVTGNLNLVAGAYNTALTVKDANGAVLAGGTLLGASEYNLKALYQANWATAATAKKTVELTFTLGVGATPVTGMIPVAKATITSNPTEIVIGQANNLVLTYADANGAPIVGKEINLVGTPVISLGKTNDKGQLVYATTGSISLKADTDTTGVTLDTTLSAVVDTKAPVVTAPATSTTSTATITITDNVRVARLMVNGTELNLIPRTELKHVVTLVAGVNTFNIVAVDNNYNVVEQVVTINYTPATSNSTVLKGTEVAQKGNYTFVQLAKFQELGATKSWNATTKTATFVYGGKTVSVTIGSTTAKVDGASVTMPVAPYLVNGFTMVPTRFIAENLGWKVDYVAGVITITLP